jgi:hypothetical protein
MSQLRLLLRKKNIRRIRTKQTVGEKENGIGLKYEEEDRTKK